MPLIDVLKKYGSLVTERSNAQINLPKNYSFLPAGDAPLTRAVKTQARKSIVYVVKERKSRHYPPVAVGIFAPTEVIEREKQRLSELRTEEHRQKLVKLKKQKQDRDIKKFLAEVKDRFPGCPEQEAMVIAEWTCKIGSGRVGRSNTADDPVRAAVVAHIRHTHTAYDDLLEQGRETWHDREEAREVRQNARWHVRSEVDAILSQWEHPDNASPPNND